MKLVNIHPKEIQRISQDLLQVEESLRRYESEATGTTEEGVNKEVYELSRKGYYPKLPMTKLRNTLTSWVIPDKMDQLRHIEETREAAEALEYWRHELIKDMSMMCTDERLPGLGEFKRCSKVRADKYLEHQTRTSNALGERCGFIDPSEKEVSILRAIDSYTNCLHSFAIKLTKMNEESRFYGLCYGSPDKKYEKEELEFCKEFTEEVEANKEAYNSWDVGYQVAVVQGSRIDVQVGSVKSHRTKIFLREGEVEIDYEDHNYHRADVFREAMESVGFECRGDLEVRCSGELSPENMRRVARVLSAMPSLDLHFEAYVDRRQEEIFDDLMADVEIELRERARDEAIEELDDVKSCVVRNLSEYIYRSEPKYPEIVDLCIE